MGYKPVFTECFFPCDLRSPMSYLLTWMILFVSEPACRYDFYIIVSSIFEPIVHLRGHDIIPFTQVALFSLNLCFFSQQVVKSKKCSYCFCMRHDHSARKSRLTKYYRNYKEGRSLLSGRRISYTGAALGPCL